MAGGSYTPGVDSVRPGTYIRINTEGKAPVYGSGGGTVLLPLIGADWGPAGEFLHIERYLPDAHKEKLGRSVFSSEGSVRLIREALKNAGEAVVCIIKEGTKASAEEDGLTAEARYGGSRGNDLKIVIEEAAAGFDVSVYLGTEQVWTAEGVSACEELAAAGCPWVDFSGSGSLSAAAGISLEGGEDGVPTLSDYEAFFAAAENIRFDCMAFPLDPDEEDAGNIFAAMKHFIKSMREDAGRYVRAVVSGFAADYEGISNITNGVVLQGGESLSPWECTAYAAGLDAAAGFAKSNTAAVYDGAEKVLYPKTHIGAVNAIRSGEMFFSPGDGGGAALEYDINSLVSFGEGRDVSFRKNRVIRTLDAIRRSITETFRPGRFDNDETGWDLIEGTGRALMESFEDAGAIREFDPDRDFVVDRAACTGDSVYINIAVQPADSAEKLYFTVNCA